MRITAMFVCLTASVCLDRSSAPPTERELAVLFLGLALGIAFSIICEIVGESRSTQ